jgi:hypothetical protein
MPQLRLRDSVDQDCDQRHQRRQEPQPPPQRTGRPLHHLVPTKTAVAVERARYSAAVPTLVKLQATVRAARLLGVVEHHGRLVATRTQAGGDKG